jgi:homoserine dehydrogenase
MRKIHIGLLGCGTVGTGVAKILMEKKELISRRVGAELVLKRIADIDIETDRGIRFDPGVLTTDAEAVLSDSEIDIVLEMIGGEGIAKKFMLQAIENGKHVVTANKALLARDGNAIMKAAIKKGVDLAYEASCGGCMPIIKTLRESMVGNRIESMIGILNGTCNYILTKITTDGSTFEEALAEAQTKGYAEADPTLDVEGGDTAHKLAIMTALASGMAINFEDIYVEGISKITPLDIQFAGQFGYRIKLLAIAKDRGAAVESRVHPTMIPVGNLMSNVSGSLNALMITGDAVGELILNGHGAGMMPTASAVISDIVDIARNILCATNGRIPVLSYQPEHIQTIPVLPIDEIETHYYFRFSAQDRPGVLSKISGVLGRYGISLKSVHQKGRETEGPVPIVMFTHRAKEADVQEAMAEIARLDIVSDRPMVIRIEDEDGE